MHIAPLDAAALVADLDHHILIVVRIRDDDADGGHVVHTVRVHRGTHAVLQQLQDDVSVGYLGSASVSVSEMVGWMDGWMDGWMERERR